MPFSVFAARCASLFHSAVRSRPNSRKHRLGIAQVAVLSTLAAGAYAAVAGDDLSLTSKAPALTVVPAARAVTVPLVAAGAAAAKVTDKTTGPTLETITSIPSNFDVAAAMNRVPVPGSAAPDPHGAFRFICTAGQIKADDPIVYPNQPGRAHLHQFFGNTAADASSTYQSLRTTGDSTCMNRLNRSAYWMPAMMDGKGGVVRPDYVTIYYKRFAADNPECRRQGKACVDIPRGLRFVFGFDMQKPNGPQDDVFYFQCNYGANRKTITAAMAEGGCRKGQKFLAQIGAPPCWNGRDLDSPDHRSHMAWPSYGSWGYLKCPATHPYIIPSFTLGAWYTVDDAKDSWYLSSDDMAMPGMNGRMPAGSTFHADWWGAWDDETMATWHANCINKMLNCSAGDLGNGTALKQVAPFDWVAKPHRVPWPS